MKIQNLKKSLRSKEDTVLQLTHDIEVLKVAIDNCSPNDMPNIRSLNNIDAGGLGGGMGGTRGRDPSKDPTVVKTFCQLLSFQYNRILSRIYFFALKSESTCWIG